MSDLDYMVQALKSQEQAPPGMLSQMPPTGQQSPLAPNALTQDQAQQPAMPQGPSPDYQQLMQAQLYAQQQLQNLAMSNLGP